MEIIIGIVIILLQFEIIDLIYKVAHNQKEIAKVLKNKNK